VNEVVSGILYFRRPSGNVKAGGAIWLSDKALPIIPLPMDYFLTPATRPSDGNGN
jgi:hypothetical protein